MNSINGFSFFFEDEVRQIHQNSLRILDEVGIFLSDPKTLPVLCDNGARAESGKVYFPPDLVERCIRNAGKRVTITGRGGASKTLGDGELYFHNLGGAPQVFDFATETRRPAMVQDVHDSTRVLDALENCHTVTPFFTPTDVPGNIMSLAMYRHSLPYTLKAVQGPGVQLASEVEYIVKMAGVIGNPSQVLTLAISPVSPLTFPGSICQAITAIAERGIALGPLPCPTAGTTAPFSIYSAVTQQNAEILSTVVLAELVKPGLPIIYCGRLAMMEPRTGLSVWGGVELGLASALTVAVGHHYGFPVNVYGFSTNAHTLDCQNGFERALNAILPVLAGADEISGIGEMEAGVMGSYSQMVLDNEFANSIKRIRSGIRKDDETINIISKAMSSTHNYLSEKHTIEWLRSGEVGFTKLAERGSWDNWVDNNKKGMGLRAHQEAERILREHIVLPLDPAQEKELDTLLEKACAEIIM